MRKAFFVTLAAAALAATASAQIPATLRLSVDEAVAEILAGAGVLVSRSTWTWKLR